MRRLCTTEEVNNPVLGLYDACHGNGVEGVTFTFASLEGDPVSFTTDATGVGSAEILDGVSSVTQVTVSADDATGGYTYCADQNSGAVLFDGTRVRAEGFRCSRSTAARRLFAIGSSTAPHRLCRSHRWMRLSPTDEFRALGVCVSP